MTPEINVWKPCHTDVFGLHVIVVLKFCIKHLCWNSYIMLSFLRVLWSPPYLPLSFVNSIGVAFFRIYIGLYSIRTCHKYSNSSFHRNIEQLYFFLSNMLEIFHKLVFLEVIYPEMVRFFGNFGYINIKFWHSRLSCRHCTVHATSLISEFLFKWHFANLSDLCLLNLIFNSEAGT